LCAMQSSDKPMLDKAWISVFAADHGVAQEGVSAFPQAVTRQRLRNFVGGGAAISVLARLTDARLEVVDMGVAEALEDSSGLILARVGCGTANFAHQPAMSENQREAALIAGAEAALRAQRYGAQIFIGGEMGIANTSSAAALACALLGADPASLTGPGTGLNTEGVRHKSAVIEAALKRHAQHLNSPRSILRHLGGFEIAALTGAYLQAAALRMPSLVDGFIASTAALIATKLQPACADWLIYGHRSAEPGHGLVLQALGARALLDLSLRLGEGSGAAVALPILRAACTLHGEMATFAEAGIPAA
ncbi:MAG: nicotinate-nucleotide--dimethylbenzimidazole phosphoribosyltransferase, partial [Methylococcaceae bacterium]|nr:nicotinate-nucleotide--dimethylbenzimidazole phosphoribosyltransferase [Methylococcaceae bacterium]